MLLIATQQGTQRNGDWQLALSRLASFLEHNCISNRKPFIAFYPICSTFYNTNPPKQLLCWPHWKRDNLLAVEFRFWYACVYVDTLIANTWHLFIQRTQPRELYNNARSENRMGGKIRCDVRLSETAGGYQGNMMLSTTNAIKLIKVRVCSSECFQAYYSITAIFLRLFLQKNLNLYLQSAFA